jgi:hypothetical protein
MEHNQLLQYFDLKCKHRGFIVIKGETEIVLRGRTTVSQIHFTLEAWVLISFYRYVFMTRTMSSFLYCSILAFSFEAKMN